MEFSLRESLEDHQSAPARDGNLYPRVNGDRTRCHGVTSCRDLVIVVDNLVVFVEHLVGDTTARTATNRTPHSVLITLEALDVLVIANHAGGRIFGAITGITNRNHDTRGTIKHRRAREMRTLDRRFGRQLGVDCKEVTVDFGVRELSVLNVARLGNLGIVGNTEDQISHFVVVLPILVGDI